MHSQLRQSLQFLALLIHTRQQHHITLWEWNNLNYNPLENDQVLLALHWLSKLYAGMGESREMLTPGSAAPVSCSSSPHMHLVGSSPRCLNSVVVIWKHEQPESFSSWSLPRPTSQCCLQVFFIPTMPHIDNNEWTMNRMTNNYVLNHVMT